MISRRVLLGAAGGAALYLTLAPAAVLAKSKTDPMRETGMPVPGLDEKQIRILSYAALAPSGHNTQPWMVKIREPNHWTIAVNSMRRLPAVDPENRELLLSIGTFAENLYLAAGAMGYEAAMRVVATDAFCEDVVDVKLTPRDLSDYPLDRLEKRRTVKNDLLDKEISQADLDYITEPLGDGFRFFPRSSEHAKCFTDGTIEANKLQVARDDAQRELAKWIRFTKKQIREHRDGLTVKGMEIQGFAGWYVSRFMDERDVMKQSFRDQTVAKVEKLVAQGGGWLVITSKSGSVADIIDAGRRFEAMALLCRERNIALHPMTQMLEEGNWDAKTEAHKGMTPQFILRAGYVKKVPKPVSPRRPIGWFVQQ